MYSFNSQNKQNINAFAMMLCNKLMHNAYKPVFLCVGSSKVVSDCLGAMVGELLTKKHNVMAYVYGTLCNNVTSENINNYISLIKSRHPLSDIYVIDACLGQLENVGNVNFNKGALLVAHKTNNSQLIGNYNITANVNVVGVNNLMFIKSLKLSTIINMSNFIACAISNAIKLRDIITSSKKYALANNYY